MYYRNGPIILYTFYYDIQSNVRGSIKIPFPNLIQPNYAPYQIPNLSTTLSINLLPYQSPIRIPCHPPSLLPYSTTLPVTLPYTTQLHSSYHQPLESIYLLYQTSTLSTTSSNNRLPYHSLSPSLLRSLSFFLTLSSLAPYFLSLTPSINMPSNYCTHFFKFCLVELLKKWSDKALGYLSPPSLSTILTIIPLS